MSTEEALPDDHDDGWRVHNDDSVIYYDLRTGHYHLESRDHYDNHADPTFCVVVVGRR